MLDLEACQAFAVFGLARHGDDPVDVGSREQGFDECEADPAPRALD
jgi:hypothetical protein